MDLLKQVGVAVTELPASFTPHKQIKKVYDARRAMIDTGGCEGCGVWVNSHEGHGSDGST